MRALLLDLGHAGQLGKTLQDMLESHTSLSVSYRQEFIDLRIPRTFETTFRRNREEVNPDLILLIVVSKAIEQADGLISRIGNEASHLPILVLFEDPTSGDVMTVIPKHGTVHFIPAPLEPVCVLQLIWRLVCGMP